jgi:putative tryptophan/tyrosine transport system substrate-binding protein
MSHWNRRRFVQGAGVAGLGLLAGCGRLPWHGQSPAPARHIGYISPFVQGDPLSTAFRQGLQEYGYLDGHNVFIADRFAEGSDDRLPRLAADLVALRVELIVTTHSLAAHAMANATHTIPIVMASSNDAVGEGLVASLARPGGNITGLTLLAPQLSAKRLELLRDTVGDVSRIAVLGNMADGLVVAQVDELAGAASALGLELLIVDIHGLGGLEGALDAVLRARPSALIGLLDLAVNVQMRQIVEFATQARLPTVWYVKYGPIAGALMAYGPSHERLHRRAAYYVDRILKGTPPADLPIEQPREFDFVINLQTAQALGLTIPPHVLAQATEVIQ